MTCEQYESLLTSVLEGKAPPDAEQQLRAHEAECPGCAALRASLDSLPECLASLKDDVPPMPEDLHQRWAEQLKEDKLMENTSRKPARRARITRILAVAAALVFVIGGTLLTRDDLPRRSASSGGSNASATVTTTSNAVRGSGYSASSALYEEAVEYEADESAPMLAEASGMVYDDYDSGTAYDKDASAEAVPARETKLIRTVSMTIATQTFDQSLEALRSGAEGGWISYSSVSTGSNGLRTAWLTLRVPADQLDAFLSGADGYGRVTRQEETTQDVTESYYDTKSRLESQKALLARYQELVARAEDLDDLLTLESAMAQVQWQIDAYTASLNATDSKVSYSTVEISLREEKEQQRVTVTDLTLGERIAAALQVGWENLTDFLEDLVVFLVAALPVLALIAVVIAAVIVIRRKRRAKKQKGE